MRSFSLILLFLLVSFFVKATIIRVNNNSAVLGTYNTAQAGHNAAAAGDTIHLETSIYSYGSVVCTKPLVWIGNGFFVDGSKASYVDNVTFSTGSANSLFLGVHIIGDALIGAANVTLSRCCMYTLTFNASSVNLCNNFNVNQSFVRNQVSYNVGNTCSGFTFTNNYFMAAFSLPSTFSNIVYSHNFFNSFSGGLSVAANNNLFNNCTLTISLYAATVYNNLFIGSNNSNYVGSNGNINTVTTISSASNTIFVGGTNTSTDSWTVLKAGSPAINAGLGGVNIGPTGGASAYKLMGIPPVPSFSQFQVQSAPVNTLPVIISTKSNN